MTELIATIPELRKTLLPYRRADQLIGFVPTMGALHAGHRHLLDVARGQTECVVASIFVNPTQFDRKDDLDRYPRTMESDMKTCSDAGVDFVFAPSAPEMYPQEQLTWVEVPQLGTNLCGAGRPGHFRGVATVVTKLLQIVQPDRAYFGEKDAQQLAIIRRMVADLNILTEIVPVPTIRESDGLAMSSRNQHLSAAERQTATALSKALFRARDLVQQGEPSPAAIRFAVSLILEGIQVEYFSFVDPSTLEPFDKIEGPVLIAAAIWLGKTRLIDNVTVRI